MRTAVKFVFLSWGASEEYATNEEMDQKEEHEHLPDNIT